MDDQHAEPASEALARMTQGLAVTMSLVEAGARLRAQHAYNRADAAERVAATARAQEELRHGNARLLWSQGLDPPVARRLTATELLQAWTAAAGFRRSDPSAGRAMDRIEARLGELHPEAMAAYREALQRGDSPLAAMSRAVPHFRGEFGFDPPGSPLDVIANAEAWDFAAQHWQTAAPAPAYQSHAQRRATTDDPTAAPAERARALADLSLPVPIDEAMATAPQAAKATLALPAAPVGRAITARPTASRS